MSKKLTFVSVQSIFKMNFKKKNMEKYIYHTDKELFGFWEDPCTKENVSWVRLIRELIRRGYVFTNNEWTKKHHFELISLLS